MLVESTKLLAASPQVQIQRFPIFVLVPDEIALTYSECFVLADQVQQAGLINEGQYAGLEQLDKLLDDLGSEKNQWSLDALVHGEQWGKIHLAARHLLESFETDSRPPNLFWITYIE
jgi:hypothetical protein